MAKTTIIRGLDEKVWHKFKELCLKDKISANAGVKKLIRLYVEGMKGGLK